MEFQGVGRHVSRIWRFLQIYSKNCEILRKNTGIDVFERSLSRFGPKLVQKVPYGSGVSENGPGI